MYGPQEPWHTKKGQGRMVSIPCFFIHTSFSCHHTPLFCCQLLLSVTLSSLSRLSSYYFLPSGTCYPFISILSFKIHKKPLLESLTRFRQEYFRSFQSIFCSS